MRDTTELSVENASLSIFPGKQPGLVERLSRVMKRGNTGARVRMGYNEERDESQVGKKRMGRSNASCFSEAECAGERKSMGYIIAEVE